MPQALTAAQIVRRAREHAQELGGGTYRDGFADDTNTGTHLISVLSFVNQAIGIFCLSGVVQDTVTVAGVVDTAEYAFPAGLGDVLYAQWEQGSGGSLVKKSLRKITTEELDRRVRDWPTRASGIPRMYIPSGGRFRLYPTPAALGTVSFRGHTLAPDLVNKTDVPSLITTQYHEAIALLAAILLCNAQESLSGRVQALLSLWDTQFKDLVDLTQFRVAPTGVGAQK